MNLFQRPYERTLWLEELHGYFPTAELFIQPHTINSGEADHFFHLGNVETDDGKSLGLYEIEAGKNTRLARNRVQLRQMVAKQCEMNSLDGALAVYWDRQGKWRFSFISIQYRFDDKGELLRKETASKRYTYLVGKGMQVRTVQGRFNQLLTNPTLQDMEAAFAVEPLNKEFYDKLYKWYDDAKQHVVFPNDEGMDKDIHKANSLIRLLTRLLFVWFIKEKGLVNKELFDPDKLPHIIDWSRPGSYYKAILQNLFFATLNREINDRSFRSDTKGKPNSTNYLAGNLYRYRDHFLKGKKEDIISLFKQAPFLNGGLFECLDREASDEEKQEFDARKSSRKERNAIRIDGFSDRADNRLYVPNGLFFNGETGLIDLLGQYQFTVEESTPLDVDVALDPELLGKVFENLLADYNPETQASARKASGSYYTPREIVTYMVDESLKAYLKQSLPTPEPLIPDVQSALLPKVQVELGHWPEVDNKLNTLFRYADSATGDIQDNLFDDAQKKELIKAIHRIKILDPAVGSGAFPMGILQRLVSLLGVLDPGNDQWKNQQLAALPELADIEADLKTARQINDKIARQKAEQELDRRRQEIEDNFNNRNHDYSRKLYLIENSIFGVDIQSIAIQICKLRFFISLAIEQNPTGNADDNYGIRALPNLETRFVVADTLLSIRGNQQKLRNPEIKKKEEELNRIRRRYFNARTLKTKRKCREQDRQLRQEIAELLMNDGWKDMDARKIAAWDPYNQSAPAADWFDAEYMFGITEGFNVVISNPPYVVSKDKLLREIYKESVFGRPNLYGYFIHQGLKNLLAINGVLIFINPRTLLTDAYCSALRTFVLRHSQIRSVMNIVDRRNVFESVLQSCIVNCFQNTSVTAPIKVKSISKKEDIPDKNWIEVPPEHFLYLQNNHPLFIVGNSHRIYDIFSKLRKLKSINEYGLSFTTGKIQWDLYKPVLGDTPQSISTRLIWAENVQRYCYAEPRLRAKRIYINGPLENHHQPIRHDTVIVQRTTAVEQERRIIAHIFSPNSFGYPIQAENNTSYLILHAQISLRFVLGILNSKFMDFVFRHINSNTHVSAGELNSLKFPALNDEADQAPIIELVDHILAAKSHDPVSDTAEQEVQIDRLVYNLYGLTDTEIAIVEGTHCEREY